MEGLCLPDDDASLLRSRLEFVTFVTFVEVDEGGSLYSVVEEVDGDIYGDLPMVLDCG